MKKEVITENRQFKMQFILDENGELQEILKDKCKPVKYPIKYKLKNAFEVFVRMEGTENYWISNYGRCVNNHHAENTFYKHKEGKVHYTIYEIEYDPVKNKRGQLTGEVERNKYKRETAPEDDLVVDAFLVKYKGRFEEAFAEYKIMKQADILLVAAKYKESIPDYIYDRLLKVEVKPY